MIITQHIVIFVRQTHKATGYSLKYSQIPTIENGQFLQLPCLVPSIKGLSEIEVVVIERGN